VGERELFESERAVVNDSMCFITRAGAVQEEALSATEEKSGSARMQRPVGLPKLNRSSLLSFALAHKRLSRDKGKVRSDVAPDNCHF
jgi:hypothetical protein